MQLRNLIITIRYKNIHLLSCQSLSSTQKCNNRNHQSLSFRTVSATPQAIGHLFPCQTASWKDVFPGSDHRIPWCFLCVTWKLLGNPWPSGSQGHLRLSPSGDVALTKRKNKGWERVISWILYYCKWGVGLDDSHTHHKPGTKGPSWCMP